MHIVSKRSLSLVAVIGMAAGCSQADVGEDIEGTESISQGKIIGTNDLVQYTLAVDRGNVNLATRFTPLHPAVLRLIKRTVEVGRAAGLEVAVCGEMASQPVMAFALIGLGVRQLSVAPRAVTLVKHIVRGISAELASEAAEAALASDNAAGAERQLAGRLRAAFGDAMFLGDGLLVG